MNASTDRPPRFVREREVVHTTGLSRTQLRRLEHSGRFPRRVPLSDRAFGWLEREIQAWIAGRLSARDQMLTVEESVRL